MIIGRDTATEQNFQSGLQFIEGYLKNCRVLIKDLGINVTDSQLIKTPLEAIKQAYLDKHKPTAPAYLADADLLATLKLDFSYIERNYMKVHAFNLQFDSLVKPDFNIYAENDKQLQMYLKLKAICDLINNLWEDKDRNFGLYGGQIANSFSGLIQSDISNLPHIQPNVSTIKSAYLTHNSIYLSQF